MFKDGVLLFNKSASILSPATAGQVQYTWASGDTDVVGLCKGEFEVTFTDGKTLTFPTKGDFTIEFREEYA